MHGDGGGVSKSSTISGTIYDYFHSNDVIMYAILI